jgi:tRNA threonylcarbamoyladenosine biosynthesis protein TsaB
MLLLALDTTTAGGSVALWHDGRLDERAGDAARSHAERLPADLVALLAAHGRRVHDVDTFAVAAGPGSFTGLRIGIATIQGLALVNDRRVHAEGTLDLLAHEAARRAETVDGVIVVAWMEAYRGEVFAARYRVRRAAPLSADGTRERGGARLDELDAACVAQPGALASAWAAASAGAPVCVIGDGVARTRAVLDAAFGPAVQLVEPGPLAGTLAALAARRPDAATRPHAVMPIYVRRPDAELARDRAAVRPTA